MDVLNFAFTVILITASGALAPGPLFFITISHGAKFGAKSGFIFSLAHSLIEFFLVLLLALGLLTVVDQPLVKIIVGLVGGVVLIVFGGMQIIDSLRAKYKQIEHQEADMRNLMLIGLAFTGLNPFFIVWWLTIGANLVLFSLEFASLTGVVLMYIFHVWVDYLLLTALAHFSKKGANVIGIKWYRAIVTLFGAVLIYFGLLFINNSVSMTGILN